MPELIFPLDSSRSFTDQAKVGHNRWHPDIPPVATVKPGDSFRVHCREWFDGAIHNDNSAVDIRDAPLSTVHALSGPFAIEGAQPGDLLVVDILDLGPIPLEDSGPLAGQGWGYTGIFPTENGGGFLTEQFPDAYKAIWDFSGQVATSRHIPGVSFTGMAHPGLMGTAPSASLLSAWNAREGALRAQEPPPGAATRAAPGAAGRRPGSPDGGRLHPRGGGSGAHCPSPGERGQPGHQEFHSGNPRLLPGLRPGSEPVDGRPAFLARRR